jgi:hypothetical protein
MIPIIFWILNLLKIPKEMREKSKWDFIYNISAITVGNILETPPNPISELRDNPNIRFYYRWLIGIWGLMAVIITSEYRNEFVVDLIAPAPIHANLTLFSQTVFYRFYVHDEFWDLIEYENNVLLYTKADFVSCFENPESKTNQQKGNMFISFSCSHPISLLKQFGLTLSDFQKSWKLYENFRPSHHSTFNHMIAQSPHKSSDTTYKGLGKMFKKWRD